ncbi:hypothetical protein H0H93_016124 [Arthromyces matolae]|nr:hypothetical protein H0H93_016124 [Arthromyces matolae]
MGWFTPATSQLNQLLLLTAFSINPATQLYQLCSPVMPRGSSQLKKKTAQAFRNYLLRPHNLKALQALCNDSHSPQAALELMKATPGHSCSNWTEFLAYGFDISTENSALLAVFQTLKSNASSQAFTSVPHVSHQEKRAAAHALGLFDKPPQLFELIRSYGGDLAAASAACHQIYGFRIVHRTRIPLKKQLSVRTIMVEKPSSQPNTAAVTSKNGFFILKGNESTVFLSGNGPDYTIELVVLRDIIMNTPFAAEIYRWLHEVVLRACKVRRDVRPNHEGKMIQVGLNMGPRHARILGWAKSFTAKLSDVEKAANDDNMIGAMSLFWNIVKAVFPVEITSVVQKCLDDAEMPTLATRHIPEGAGFTIPYNGKDYTFRTAERAPPEALATCGYSGPVHIDPAFCPWAFSWTVSREAVSGKPHSAGSSYVDVGLKVVVQAASGTMSAAQPNHRHGTTVSAGMVNCGFATLFTRRVEEGYRDMLAEGPRVIAFAPDA